MQKLYFTIITVIFSLVGLSQSGKITVRKASTNIIGKTLQLTDLRGAKSGTINFKKDSSCLVHFKLELKNIILKENFENQIPSNEKLNCSYSIINDTLLVLKHKNYSDTCYYNYTNDTNNLVQLKNTLHGVIISDFAICYHFDSILYSQTFNQTQANSNFNENIEIDSIYRNVKDRKLKKELETVLKSEIEQYKQNLSFNYFKGKYSINENKLELLSNEVHFANLNINKSGTNTSITSAYTLDGSIPVTSTYTHNNYGFLIILYDKVILNYYHPQSSRIDGANRSIIIKDTFNVNYVAKNEIQLFNKTDTFSLWQNEHFSTARINNIIGGYYQTRLKSVNNNATPYKKLLFTVKGTFLLTNDYKIVSNKKWDYHITDSVLFVYNETDTLIDELTNSWESFSFTYKNNEPFAFGTYHLKTSNKHEFLILFKDGTGAKYTSNSFDYKKTRESLNNNTVSNLPSKNLEKFKYSATKEHLWIYYNNGEYTKLNFFNYCKAIRHETSNKVRNYYLIE